MTLTLGAPKGGVLARGGGDLQRELTMREEGA